MQSGKHRLENRIQIMMNFCYRYGHIINKTVSPSQNNFRFHWLVLFCIKEHSGDITGRNPGDIAEVVRVLAPDRPVAGGSKTDV